MVPTLCSSKFVSTTMEPADTGPAVRNIVTMVTLTTGIVYLTTVVGETGRRGGGPCGGRVFASRGSCGRTVTETRIWVYV